MEEMLFMRNDMVKRKIVLGRVVGMICLAAGVLALAGCGSNRQEMAKQVLEKDPKFGEVLQKKSEVDTQILEIEEDVKAVRTRVEGEVAKLNQELAAKRREANQKITELKKKLEPDQDKVKAEIKSLQLQLHEKRKSLNQVKDRIEDRRRLITKGNRTALSPEEQSKLQERMAVFEKEQTMLQDEILRLENDIKILKIKLRLIK